MPQQQCDKCGETVDATRAFCPGCGNVLVEEKKRTTISEFESLDHTAQIGQTMYNRMLSDMGLNISKQPNAPEKRAEATAPTARVQPPAKGPTEPTAPATVPSKKSQGSMKWIVIAAAVMLLLALIVVAVAALVVWLTGRS